MCFSPQRRAIFRHQNLRKCSKTLSFLTCWLQNVLFATAACNFSTSEHQKVLRSWRVLYIFTSECAFRHSGVHFFRRQNFKKCSRTLSFLAFWLHNVLFATAACNFSTSELQKMLRNWGVLYTFTWKCAFRHSGVQFLISPLTTWLRTRRFNRPTFRLTRHTNHWKNAAFRDFSNIWRGCIFFLLTFALLHLLSADLTTLLCFSTVHIVGSLLFKLPSIIYHMFIPIVHRCSMIFLSTLGREQTKKENKWFILGWRIHHPFPAWVGANGQKPATSLRGKSHKLLEDISEHAIPGCELGLGHVSCGSLFEKLGEHSLR